jgi:hypothetical protein
MKIDEAMLARVESYFDFLRDICGDVSDADRVQEAISRLDDKTRNWLFQKIIDIEPAVLDACVAEISRRRGAWNAEIERARKSKLLH